MRTDEEKLLQDYITVNLGGKEYEIKPLVIRDSREWRKKLFKLLSSLPKYATIETNDTSAFETAVSGIVNEMSDDMINLFFEYAKDLDRDEIETNATEDELSKAMDKILEVALPLVRSLTKSMAKMGQ